MPCRRTTAASLRPSDFPSTVPETQEVLVLGAGIAGSALAYHLARRGVGPATVFDPSPLSGATGRAAGILTEQLWNRWDVEIVRATKAEYQSLAAQRDPTAYEVNGLVRWASGPDALRSMDDASVRLRRWSVDVRTLSGTELAEIAPFAKFDERHRGLFSSKDAIVTPSAMAGIYLDLARKSGVAVEGGSAMTALRRVEEGWELEGGATHVRARSIVVAAGAWSPAILRLIGQPAPMVPYRTQAAVLRPEPGAEPFPSIHDIDEDVYARPDGGGRVLAGDGTELVATDPDRARMTADASFEGHVAEFFDRRLPAWREAHLLGSWAGVCVATPDRRPLIGPLPGSRGVYLLAGFNGFGVMRAGGAAARLADLLASGGDGAREMASLETVLPARFPDPPIAFLPRPGFTLDDGSDPKF